MPFVLLLIVLWFGGEIGGAFAGGILSAILEPNAEPNFLLCYLGAIVCAIIGALIAFRIVGPLQTALPGSRLEVRDADLPVLKERWGDRNAAPDGRGTGRPDGEEKYRPESR